MRLIVEKQAEDQMKAPDLGPSISTFSHFDVYAQGEIERDKQRIKQIAEDYHKKGYYQ